MATTTAKTPITSASIEFEVISFETASSHAKFEALRADLAQFLYVHMGDYGDDLIDIERCLDYAASPAEGKGGVVIVAQRSSSQTSSNNVTDDTIVGAVILNHTGMQGYIPEHILVYIAVHGDTRGQGLGKTLMQHAVNAVPGSIALHVEEDNPARKLYAAMGFQTKYLEMRLQR
ncbi:MAG: GNAT family N-acetyltransferase [Deinococcota bacterium]